MKIAIAIATLHRGSLIERDNRCIFVYIEIRATQLPRRHATLQFKQYGSPTYMF